MWNILVAEHPYPPATYWLVFILHKVLGGQSYVGLGLGYGEWEELTSMIGKLLALYPNSHTLHKSSPPTPTPDDIIGFHPTLGITQSAL